jgi:ABC-type glycerol-3-phosphate transport system substrate-binding protein
MNNFQTVLVAVFLSFFVFAVLIFSGVIKIGSDPSVLKGKISIWGTLPNTVFSELIESIVDKNQNLSLNYSQKDILSYQQDLIEAFAEGKGPDLFVITPDMIQRNDNFIFKIPFDSYPEKIFRDTYIDGASIYLDNVGIIGMPLFVDPIVLYFNKDILSNEGIVNPPKTWDELFELNQVLTRRENDGTINRSMIALGHYNNINNVKDILATLLIQNDNPITKRDKASYFSMLNSNLLNLSISPIEAVLRFFISFSNPSNTAYSWNQSLQSSFNMFTSGKLAFYIGKASELFNIEAVNPNLSFDVTEIPQIKDYKTKRTYGDIYAIVVNKRSPNINLAFQMASEFSKPEKSKQLSIKTSLPPVNKVLLKDKPADNPYLFTFFNSALIARSWADPDRVKSDIIFKEMIDNILSNKLPLTQAVNKAHSQLDLLMKKSD